MQAWSDFKSEAQAFRTACLELEASNAEPRLQSLQKPVMPAFRLTRDGVSFQDLLRKLGRTTFIVDSKSVHQINTVANYWGISRSLSQVSRAREYRMHFVDPNLKTLQSYVPRWSGYKPRYIHAEIQLVVHYELLPMEQPPRIIGASKQACYLCNSFIKADRQFSVMRSLGQIYCLWTVPGRRDCFLEW